MYGKQTRRSPLKVRRAIGLGVILLGSVPVVAEDGRWYTNDQTQDGETGALVRTGGAGSRDMVTGHLRKRFPQLKIGEIETTPVKGIVVVKAGSDYVYLSEDGRHAFVGSLVNLETGANLTEDGKGQAAGPRRLSGL